MSTATLELETSITLTPKTEKAEPKFILTTIPCPNTVCFHGWIETDNDWHPCVTCDRACEIEVVICSDCTLGYDDCKCAEQDERNSSQKFGSGLIWIQGRKPIPSVIRGSSFSSSGPPFFSLRSIPILLRAWYIDLANGKRDGVEKTQLPLREGASPSNVSGDCIRSARHPACLNTATSSDAKSRVSSSPSQITRTVVGGAWVRSFAIISLCCPDVRWRFFCRSATSSTCFCKAKRASSAARCALAVFRCSSASCVCSLVRSALAFVKSADASSRTRCVSISVFLAASVRIFSFWRSLSTPSAALKSLLVLLFQTEDAATAAVIRTLQQQKYFRCQPDPLVITCRFSNSLLSR